MTGFLADLGLENVEDDPNAFPDGTYNAYLTAAKVQGIKNNTEKRLVLTYKIFEGPYNGRTIDEWKNCDPTASDRDKSWLKQRLKTLGVPEERFANLNPDDLVGIAVRITTKRNGQYRNVTNVALGHAGTQEGVQASASAALDAPVTTSASVGGAELI